MSDQEFYFDDVPEDDIIVEDDDPGVEDDGGVEGGDKGFEGGDDDEGPPANTPEARYAAAKSQVDLDDDTALQEFTELYSDEDCPARIRARSLRQMCILQARHNLADALMESIELVFSSYKAELLDSGQVYKTINSIAANVHRWEDTQRRFLSETTDKIDRQSMLGLFLDLKLTQAELALKGGDYPSVSEFVREAAQFCPIPPDRGNMMLCRSAIRILVLQIEVADNDIRVRGDDAAEKRMFQYFEQASELPTAALNVRQIGVLKRLEGIKAIRDGQYSKARVLLWEAFRIFNEAGIVKRVHCLQYCALAAMLAEEKIGVFQAEALPMALHPVCAPISQLMNAYLARDIVEFNAKIETVVTSFHNKELYKRLIDKIRVYVLAKAIKRFCRPFSRVDVAYLAKRLNSRPEEVGKLTLDLILKKRLNGLIDADTGMIIMKAQRHVSPYTLKLEVLVDGLEKAIADIERAVIG
jgi:COP9 signalosome complex subunit 2